MNKRDFIPKDELERAILKGKNGEIIRLIAEGHRLFRFSVLAEKQFFSLPLRTAAVVLRCGMTPSLRKSAREFLQREAPDSEVSGLLDEVESIPRKKPSPEEALLLQNLLDGKDRKACRQIKAEGVTLRNMTPEGLPVLCRALMSLKASTVVLLLAAGIHDASVPVLLEFLLRACEEENLWNGIDYKGRLMYANLLIHILQGEITPEDDDLIEQDWYPMGNSIKDGCDRRVYCHAYSYCFDPRHLYEPRYIDGEYEKAECPVRRP